MAPALAHCCQKSLEADVLIAKTGTTASDIETHGAVGARNSTNGAAVDRRLVVLPMLVSVLLLGAGTSSRASGPPSSPSFSPSPATASYPIAARPAVRAPEVRAPAYQTPTTVFVGPPIPTSTTVAPSGVWPLPAGQLHRKLAEGRTGPNPKQVAFTPNGKELWTPLLGSTGVDVFRVPDMQKIARIQLGTYGGVEVVFTKDSKRAYVSQMQTASVYEIDVDAKRLLRVLKTGGNWTKVLELSPDELTLYAANWVSDDISVIDLRTGALKGRIPTVDTPRGLVVSNDGKSLFVAGFENGDIVRIDLAPAVPSTTSSIPVAAKNKKPPIDFTSTQLLRTGGAMRHLVLDRARNLLYADDMGHDTTHVIDLATGQVRLLATTDSHPNTIDLSPDGHYLYVSNRGQNSPNGYNQFGPDFGSVIVLDVATGVAVDAIVGGNQTTGLDVSPDGTLLAFTDFQDSRVQLYAIPPLALLQTSDGTRARSYKSELLRRKP